MPPDPAFRGGGVARRTGWRGSRRRHRGCSNGSASSTTARTGGRARSRRTTTRSRRRSSTSAAGWTRTSMRRSGCRRACSAPTRTIVGNWVHGLPASATPGPNLDELHEMVRFFDRWLKGDRQRRRQRAADRLVRARVRRARAVPGEPARSLAGGRGVPAPGGRAARVGVRRRRRCRSSGGWCRTGRADGDRRPRRRRPLPAPRDGRDAGVAVVGRRRPAERPGARPPPGREPRADLHLRARSTTAVEILGVPEVVLHLAVSAPVATAVVRLTDVAPDGTSAQVTAGILNLTHRRSHAAPGAARARPASRRSGSPCDRPATGSLPGHRIRVSVASSAWPVIWPSPYPGRPSSCTAGRRTPSRLILPVVPPAGGPGDVAGARRSRRRRRTSREVGGEGERRRARSGGSRGRDRRTRSRSRSTTAARTSSTTAGGSTRPRRSS